MYLHEQDPIKYPQQLLGARTFGLLMIGVGLLMLVLATWQHRQQTKYLQTYFANAPFSLSLVLAGLIGGLGVLGLIAAIFQP